MSWRRAVPGSLPKNLARSGRAERPSPVRAYFKKSFNLIYSNNTISAGANGVGFFKENAKMLKAEVRASIYNGLADLFFSAGFKGNKREASFTRSFDGGFQRIGIPLVDYAPTFQFSLHAMIRIDLIEGVSRRFNPVLPQYSDMSVSIVAGLRYLLGYDFEFEVKSPDMLADSIVKLRSIVMEKMLPFLDQCHNVEAADVILNDPEGALLQMDPKHRALSGVVAAGFCKRRDLNELAAYYREILLAKKYSSDSLSQLDSTVAYILERQ